MKEEDEVRMADRIRSDLSEEGSDVSKSGSFVPGSPIGGGAREVREQPRDLEREERNTFYERLRTYTPRRIFHSAIATPIKNLVLQRSRTHEERLVHQVSKTAQKKKPSSLAWFSIGVLVLCFTMATFREGTKVPSSNFWQKSVDCNEGDIYCSFQDVTCTSRDKTHHCIDPVE